MKLTNTFEVPLDAEATWSTLMDIEHVASCVPGARLKEIGDDGRYKGEIAVRLGPVALSFAGTAVFVEQDDKAKVAVVKAQGADTKGRGGASANIRISLAPGQAGGTQANLETDVNLSGSIAQYGRAAGMIQGLATEITNQFAANLRDSIQAQQKPAALETPPAGEIADPVVSSSPSRPVPRNEAKAIGGFSLFFKVLFQRLAGIFSSGR